MSTPKLNETSKHRVRYVIQPFAPPVAQLLASRRPCPQGGKHFVNMSYGFTKFDSIGMLTEHCLAPVPCELNNKYVSDEHQTPPDVRLDILSQLKSLEPPPSADYREWCDTVRAQILAQAHRQLSSQPSTPTRSKTAGGYATQTPSTPTRSGILTHNVTLFIYDKNGKLPRAIVALATVVFTPQGPKLRFSFKQETIWRRLGLFKLAEHELPVFDRYDPRITAWSDRPRADEFELLAPAQYLLYRKAGVTDMPDLEKYTHIACFLVTIPHPYMRGEGFHPNPLNSPATRASSITPVRARQTTLRTPIRTDAVPGTSTAQRRSSPTRVLRKIFGGSPKRPTQALPSTAASEPATPGPEPSSSQSNGIEDAGSTPPASSPVPSLRLGSAANPIVLSDTERDPPVGRTSRKRKRRPVGPPNEIIEISSDEEALPVPKRKRVAIPDDAEVLEIDD